MFTTQSKRSKLFHNIVMVSRPVILHSSFVECNHFYSTTILCVTRNLTASVWTSDTERSAHSPAPVPPSEMLLSVEPVMLTKAPRDPTQEEPQPSTSTSHFCIGSPATPGPMATTARPASGRFSLLTHGCGGWFVVLRGKTFLPLEIHSVSLFYASHFIHLSCEVVLQHVWVHLVIFLFGAGSAGCQVTAWWW